ncbi:MAG: hypothetical protein E6Z15_27270, partial [Paenibacillus macerans]|nr:hypothetical protein [Paenibacillus macerans]
QNYGDSVERELIFFTFCFRLIIAGFFLREYKTIQATALCPKFGAASLSYRAVRDARRSCRPQRDIDNIT